MDVQSAAVHIERVPGALLSMRSGLLCMGSGYPISTHALLLFARSRSALGASVPAQIELAAQA